MLQRVIDYFRPPPIRSRAALQPFLSSQASYLAQRSTYEFSRNTLSYYGQGAWHDPVFQDLMRVCRWESFAAVLADMIVLTEGRLRPSAGGDPNVLVEPLLDLYRAIIGEYPVPAHRAEGWDADIASFRQRLERAQMIAPMAPSDVALVGARRVFDVLPVYSQYREVDYQVIEGAVRFGIIAFNDQLRARLQVAAVLADLRPDLPAAAAASG